MLQLQATRRISAPADPDRVRLAISRLRALPAFYPTVQKAQCLLNDPLTSNAQIEQVMSTDQAVAARVLQLANSAYFGLASRVTTVSLALTLIGRERVSTLLRRFLVEEMIHMLSGHKPAATRIREISVVTATAAHSMAERMLRADKEEILLAGLLHNVGELVLLSQFRADYEEMLRRQRQIPRREAEMAMFGVDSPLAGRWLLEAWGLPEYFLAIVEHWPDPWEVRFPPAPVVSITLVHTARRMAEWWLEGRGREEVEAFCSTRLLSTLEVGREFLLDSYSQLPAEIERVKGTLA